MGNSLFCLLIQKYTTMIKMQVIGNLGRDCTTNIVNGKTVMNFTVAHTEKFKDAQGGQKERTVWVDCAYWSEKTGIAPYLKKGTQVYVEGNPDLRTYNKADGTFGATITLRVMGIQLLGSKPSDSGSSSESGHGGNYANQPEASISNEITEAADDLPF